MKYPSLASLIEKLKSSPRVKGIFCAGTTATTLTPSSDIDLVIIIDKNSEGIKSIFTTIENHFSDLYFFDMDFLNQLKDKDEIFGNNFDGIFLTWLATGKIEYDPENVLSEIKHKATATLATQKVPDSEKRDFWVKINYNFVANSRYYSSKDKIYHKALELRLLHSVIELITAYFAFRGIPWRGEKSTVKYLQQNDREFLAIFERYTNSTLLTEKMKFYIELFNGVLFGEYRKWEDDFLVAISNKNQYDQNLNKFWDSLFY
ncbi:hypothetical protein HY626_00480 [Candidatus Uhrbacteria bacterium]|nr:hypothetical protein [Candidatus Uhrbacteria bacterium]